MIIFTVDPDQQLYFLLSFLFFSQAVIENSGFTVNLCFSLESHPI